MRTYSVPPLIKWIGSGGIAFIVDLAVLATLVEIFSWHYLPAVVASFTTSATTNYTVSRLAIFHQTKETVAASYVKFFAISVGGLAALSGGIFVLVDVIGIHYLWARVFMAGTLGVGSFFIHRSLAFKLNSTQRPSSEHSNTQQHTQ